MKRIAIVEDDVAIRQNYVDARAGGQGAGVGKADFAFAATGRAVGAAPTHWLNWPPSRAGN